MAWRMLHHLGAGCPPPCCHSSGLRSPVGVWHAHGTPSSGSDVGHDVCTEARRAIRRSPCRSRPRQVPAHAHLAARHHTADHEQIVALGDA